MTNLKPCPLCSGGAKYLNFDELGDPCGAWCPTGCGIRTRDVETWNRLPRPSEAVLEVAREIGKYFDADTQSMVQQIEKVKLLDWRFRLEAAPGMGAPGEVWVHGPGCHGVTVYSQKQGDKPVGADGRWYRVDDLLIKEGTPPKADVGEGNHAPERRTGAVVPQRCGCVSGCLPTETRTGQYECRCGKWEAFEWGDRLAWRKVPAPRTEALICSPGDPKPVGLHRDAPQMESFAAAEMAQGAKADPAPRTEALRRARRWAADVNATTVYTNFRAIDAILDYLESVEGKGE